MAGGPFGTTAFGAGDSMGGVGGPSTVRVVQPGASLAWLQASHKPWMFSALVVPPARTGRMWSKCRMGAPHHGVRHTWSLAAMNRAKPSGTSRARESMPTSWPVDGAV